MTTVMDQLLEDQAALLNDFQMFLQFQHTWIFKQFVNSPAQVLGLFKGNQAGGTSSVSYQYVLRIFGLHPVPKKNVTYWECGTTHQFNFKTKPKDNVCPICQTPVTVHVRGSRILRFAAESLPMDKETVGEEGGASAEIKNTVYPELKKWLPRSLIKRDITARNTSMIVRDPLGGDDIVLEFVSYNQTVQQGAGVQRISCHCCEEPPKAFFDEQLPRLLAEDGDIIVDLTPANQLSWTYDEIFERAEVYYRTKAIADFTGRSRIEKTELQTGIAVFCFATDDNPTLSKDTITAIFSKYDDPDVIATRRYGVHKQISGRIFKGYDRMVHEIDPEKVFEDKIPWEWNHVRLVDYHEETPWACLWMAMSPTDEVFAYEEMNPAPSKMVTSEITRRMAELSGDYKYRLNLIDPHASKTQSNTGLSVLDDFNRHFAEYRREGIGTGGYWESWDTKSTKGRDAIRMRLKNSKLVGKPFNNQTTDRGIKSYLPTIWIFRTCVQTARSLREWRLEEWADPTSKLTKEQKQVPQQRWSHFPTAMEAAFKDQRFRPMLTERASAAHHQRRAPSYFQSAVR